MTATTKGAGRVRSTPTQRLFAYTEDYGAGGPFRDLVWLGARSPYHGALGAEFIDHSFRPCSRYKLRGLKSTTS
jgi:hypothetical protein